MSVSIEFRNLDQWLIEQGWIQTNDAHFAYLQRLVQHIFSTLVTNEQQRLTVGLQMLINCIIDKFNFRHSKEQSPDQLFDYLTLNENMNLRALLNMLLPFINDDEMESKKQQLDTMANIYLAQDNHQNYIYSNAQYNRCIRYYEQGELKYMKRPYQEKHFIHNLFFLVSTIDTVAHQLYVNWVDVVPVPMNTFTQKDIYQKTFDKLNGSSFPLTFAHGYLDMNDGLSFSTIYNVTVNHLFHDIRAYRWLMYEIFIDEEFQIYLSIFEHALPLTSIWQKRLWSQLEPLERHQFEMQWHTFLHTAKYVKVLQKFFYFFAKNHVNSRSLILQSKIVLASDSSAPSSKITPTKTEFPTIGLSQVPAEEIYLFLNHQLTQFRTSWYYYMIKIRKQTYFEMLNTEFGTFYITSKNVYNFAKSLSRNILTTKFTTWPRHWYSLKRSQITMFLQRLYQDHTWFNISKNIRRVYDNLNKEQVQTLNKMIHDNLREKLINVIFESMIFHGQLSEFHPQIELVNKANVTGDARMVFRDRMRALYFTGQVRSHYEKDAYYWITSEPYGTLVAHDTQKNIIPYFDFLNTQIWMFTYAMNWCSQINFYHKYMNCRVIYITGSTGVGKSTQVPKLLWYGQRIIDFNMQGKIVCTQPRIAPTLNNAEMISRELGVSVSIPTPLYDQALHSTNYHVQYKYKGQAHINTATPSFLRIVTDGTLYEELISMPWLTTSRLDEAARPSDFARIYSAKNKYDIIIVDEAHEHNPNMDMILTMMRDACYVNNTLRLIIVSATMDDDEPIYRHYYRSINDNRAYPLSRFIETLFIDRANIDRRIHISPPGATTQYAITKIDHVIPMNAKTLVDKTSEFTLELINNTSDGDILIFLPTANLILKAVAWLNARLPDSVIAVPFYRQMEEYDKNVVGAIDKQRHIYLKFKEDIEEPLQSIKRKVTVPYQRFIIIATNIAEASITISTLKYVVDTGVALTVYYDVMNHSTNNTLTSISKSSMDQRSGRVGRTQAGTVYYLYDREQVNRNKTIYQISSDDNTNMLMRLMQSDARDWHIITHINDVNNIVNLLDDKFDTIENMYAVLKNPRAYEKIIQHSYALNDELYNYFGAYNDYDVHHGEFMEYNDDDYLTYQIYQEFASRGFTGYTSHQLQDMLGDFYIIHPEEATFNRDLHTGRIKSLKYVSTFSSDYYNILFETNDWPKSKVAWHNYDFTTLQFDRITLIKMNILLDRAQYDLRIAKVQVRSSDIVLTFAHTAQAEFIREYYQLSANLIESPIFIVSRLCRTLTQLHTMLQISLIDNYSKLQWYAQTILLQCENEALAVMTFYELKLDHPLKVYDFPFTKSEIKSYINTFSSFRGELYMIWNLWQAMKNVLNLQTQFDNFKIQNDFDTLKSLYGQSNAQLSYANYVVFDALYTSGYLHTEHEFYYYMQSFTFQAVDFIKQPEIHAQLQNLAHQFKLTLFFVQNLAIKMINNAFQTFQKLWLHQYESDHHLESDQDEMYIVEILKTLMILPQIQHSIYELPNVWDNFIATFASCFASQLAVRESNHYVLPLQRRQVPIQYWTEKIKIEQTLLQLTSPWIVFYEIDGDQIFCLVNVNPNQLLKWNPLYFYYVLLSPQAQDTSNEYLTMLRNQFNTFDLIVAIDALQSSYLTQEIRHELMQLQ